MKRKLYKIEMREGTVRHEVIAMASNSGLAQDHALEQHPNATIIGTSLIPILDVDENNEAGQDEDE